MSLRSFLFRDDFIELIEKGHSGFFWLHNFFEKFHINIKHILRSNFVILGGNGRNNLRKDTILGNPVHSNQIERP